MPGSSAGNGTAAAEPASANGAHKQAAAEEQGYEETTTGRLWLEEELGDGLKWSMLVKQVLHAGQSPYQTMELLDTAAFGKVLLLDGKVQSAEADEKVYHELLVHPAMLHHPAPRRVFICGGGEGSTARELLRYACVERVVMVDIDKAVCDFCRQHLGDNTRAYADERLTLVNDDARAQLEAAEDGSFDVIIGDLADPLEGGPCYQLYTDEFYRDVVLRKLAPGGLFVTQAGPAGVLSAHEVFAPIYHTLASVFPRVQAYSEHIPSYCDRWSWCLAFKDAAAAPLSAQEFDARLAERLPGHSTHYLDGATYEGVCVLSKLVRQTVAATYHILTRDAPRFIHGAGSCHKAPTAPA